MVEIRGSEGRHSREKRMALRGPAVIMLCLVLVTSLTSRPFLVRADTLTVGSAVQVTGTGGDGLNVRSSAASTGAVVGVEKDGARGVIQEGPVPGGTFIWWRVLWSGGVMGWSVGTYLTLATPSPTPSAPTALAAVAGVESAVLSWSPPEDSGTAPITAWRIYRDSHVDPSTLVATLNVGDQGFDTRTWTDGPMLLGGRSYWYAVSAVNVNGMSALSASVQVIPQAAPMPSGVFFLPPQLDFGGDETSLVLTLQNAGSKPVTFIVAPGASWLVGVSPAMGSVPVSGVQHINIGVQRTGMPAGTYESLVRVTCSTGSINIPVQMRVGMIQGVDVAHWQSTDQAGNPLNWAAVRATGFQFAYVKATEGLTITDSSLNVLVPGARAAGMLAGVYHICWPGDDTAAAEAASFLQAAGQYIAPGFLVPVLDIEPKFSIHGAAMVHWIDAWAGAVRAAKGVTPVIYCSSSVAADLHTADPTIDSRYHLWLANYAASAQPNTGGWGSWAFWQYTDAGTVPGIEGHSVDLDWFNGNEQTMAQYVIGGASPTSSYTLVSAVIGNGLLNIEPQTTSYPAGSTVTVTAKPAAGWEFSGWSGSVTGTANPLALTMDANKSFVATFKKSVDPNQHIITLSVGSKIAHLDGQLVTLDTPPVIVSGRTLVPLRPIIEGLGGAITWVPETRSVEVVFNGTTLLLQIGNRTAVVNGKAVTLDVPAAIMNGRTMLPVRFVSEHLGADVQWAPLTKTVTITVTVTIVSAGGTTQH
ncbi:MAG: stalk domain-containing protein [Candidatus Cryosericum sp.]